MKGLLIVFFFFSWNLEMPGNRDRNKAGEGLMWKNKWKRYDFSNIEVGKDRNYRKERDKF